MFDVRILDDNQINREVWEEYVNTNSSSTLDHCWEWRWILEKAFGFKPYYFGAFQRGQLCGVLPLFHVPRGFGRSSLVSIPFGNYGGICADSDGSTKALFEEAKKLMKRLKCEHMALHHKVAIDSLQLEVVDDRSKFSLPITSTPEVHFKAMRSGMRNKVRYGFKHGLTIDGSRDMGPLYKIHVHKFRKHGTPCFPKVYFDLIFKYFKERVEIRYAYYKDTPIAFQLNHTFKSTLVSTVLADDGEHLKLNPNVCLGWDLIKVAANRGLHEIDACRSKRGSGAAIFKKNLGLQEHPLGYQYYVKDQKKLSRRDPRDIKFQLASRLWRVIPLECTKFLGPKIVRYFA